jgi:hypothetical protein
MDRRRSEMKKGTLAAVVVLSAISLMLAAPPAEAKPPAGKKYASALVFKNPLTGMLDMELGCLIFKKNGTLRTEEDDVGTWEFVEGTGKKQFRAVILLNIDGVPVQAEGIGTIEKAGPGSSIGGTLKLDIFGVLLNGSAGGTQSSLGDCTAFGQSDE